MEKRIRLLITSAWFPSDKNTSGVFVKEQGEALQREGYDVTFLVVTLSSFGVRLRSRFGKKGLNYDKSENCKVIHVDAYLPLPGAFYSDPQRALKDAALRQVEKRIRREPKPDVIHHHCLSDNAYVAEHLSKALNVPYVFTEHSNYFSDAELAKFNRFETFDDRKRFVQNAAERIAVSAIRAEGYRKIYDAPFIVVPNVVARLFEQPAAPRPSVPFGFCCVAFLDKRKRQDLLIRAFAKEFKGNDVVLRLAGSGPLKETYRELAAAEGVEKQVEFLGKLDRQSVCSLFDRSHACVLSSDQETFGVVLAEAMFRGLPVIATASGGPEEVVREGAGFVVEKGNVVQLAQKMRFIYDNYSSFSAEQIAAGAKALYSEKNFAQKIGAVYRKAIGR